MFNVLTISFFLTFAPKVSESLLGLLRAREVAVNLILILGNAAAVRECIVVVEFLRKNRRDGSYRFGSVLPRVRPSFLEFRVDKIRFTGQFSQASHFLSVRCVRVGLHGSAFVSGFEVIL